MREGEGERGGRRERGGGGGEEREVYYFLSQYDQLTCLLYGKGCGHCC